MFAMDMYMSIHSIPYQNTLSSLSLTRLLLLPKGSSVWGTGCCSVRLVPSLHAFQACKGILLDLRVAVGLSEAACCGMTCKVLAGDTWVVNQGRTANSIYMFTYIYFYIYLFAPPFVAYTKTSLS